MGFHASESFDDADRAFLASFAPPDGSRIPDGAIVEGIITVVSFIEPVDGGQLWFVHANSDLPLTQMVGLLDMAKLRLIAATPGAIPGIGDDGDDE